MGKEEGREVRGDRHWLADTEPRSLVAARAPAQVVQHVVEHVRIYVQEQLQPSSGTAQAQGQHRAQPQPQCSCYYYYFHNNNYYFCNYWC